MKRIRYRLSWLNEDLVVDVEETADGVVFRPVFVRPLVRPSSSVPTRVFTYPRRSWFVHLWRRIRGLP